MFTNIRILLCGTTIFLASTALAGEKPTIAEPGLSGPAKMALLQGRQIGSAFLSPDWIDNPEIAKPYIKRNADLGYSSMILFVRSMKLNVLDKRVHDAVKAMVAYGHQRGLKMLLDTDHYWWEQSLVESHPETALWAIRSVETTVQNGQFEMRVSYPQLPGQIVFQEISAVFAADKDGYRYIPGETVQSTNQNYQLPTVGMVLKGQLSEPYSGKAVFYVATRISALVDVAQPHYLKRQEELLDSYADVPLDGFAWDEPGKGLGDLSFFKAGAGFMDLFKRQNGYDLRPNLIYLDHLDGTSKATKVRCDYYGTLTEMNYRAQKRHNDYARKIFKNDLMFGTHQTWSGFSADLVAGSIDYFKLGKVLTAAWTDGGWDYVEMKYAIQNFMMAEGLKKELGMRDAYYNDWGVTQPGLGNMQCANRLKMLFHVNWFGCATSDYCESVINYTQEPIRSAAEKDVRNLDRFDRMVGNDFAPHTDVAYLYSWETLAAAPKWMARFFYTFITNTSLHLIDRAQYAAMMSGESIRKAEIGDRCFKVNGFTYRVLLMPYINTIDEAVYRKAMRITEAGVPVIVIGPPPEFTTKGKDIAEDFARRVGFKPFNCAQYATILAEQTTLPAVNDWEPSWIDATYPVETTTAQKVYDQDHHLLYVKSANGSLYYMPTPDPREELTTLIATLTTPLVETYAEDTYYRFFPHRTDRDQMVVVAVAKAHVASFGLTPEKYGRSLPPPIRPHYLKAMFRFNGGDLTLKGGSWCAVRMKKDQVMETIGDCPDVRWNGRQIP